MAELRRRKPEDEDSAGNGTSDTEQRRHLIPETNTADTSDQVYFRFHKFFER